MFFLQLISFLYIGAAYAQAEKPLQEFVERCKLPFLPTPMGKGVTSDEHPLCVAAARSRYFNEFSTDSVCKTICQEVPFFSFPIPLGRERDGTPLHLPRSSIPPARDRSRIHQPHWSGRGTGPLAN